ncbi:hypothetical protein MMC07_008971 [Pseudocyphellaria aurata]|nr:hypothetical protein [Pseudocyphellaria aurata]
MVSLLALPRELRDDIWEKACLSEFPPHVVTKHNLKPSAPTTSSSNPAHRLLRTNRQIYHEATPYVYETTVVHLSHPYDGLRWVQSIGTRNSACIRHLVLKFTSLSVQNASDKRDALQTWSASLRLLPNLRSLTFNYEPKEDGDEPGVDAPEERPVERPVSPTSTGEEVATLPEPETLKLQKSRSYDPEMRDLRPDFRFQSITHAVLAIHEPMPSILVLYFAKLLKLSSASSLEQNVTCLPSDFLAGRGFYPTRTYALTEGPPSIVFTYRKLDAPPQWPMRSAPNLDVMLSQLPQLSYLRLGCRQVDSSILAAIPEGIKTLDIAFTDPCPAQVADNLRKMRARCTKLFILTIAVSPLHDEPAAPSDDEDAESMESADARETMLAEQAEFWEPFWDALSHVQSTGVRVWEGEGAGFRKFSRRDGGGGSTMLQML